jgi:hypothetical protein
MPVRDAATKEDDVPESVKDPEVAPTPELQDSFDAIARGEMVGGELIPPGGFRTRLVEDPPLAPTPELRDSLGIIERSAALPPEDASRIELYERAKVVGIRGRSRMTKAELRAALEAYAREGVTA